MLITVPAMIWSTLWRDAQPGEEEADAAPPASIAATMPTITPTSGRSRSRRGRRSPRSAADARPDEHLALERDVQHPAPLGQDAGEGAQRDRRPRLQAPGEHAGQVRRPCRPAGPRGSRRSHGADQQEQPRPPRGTLRHGAAGAAPTTPDGDRRQGSTARRPSSRAATPRRPVVSIQNENVAWTSIELRTRRQNATMPSTAKTTPRMRASRSARGPRGSASPGASVGGGRTAVGLAGASARRSAVCTSERLRTLHPPDRPDQARRGHEHDDERHDEDQQVERDARLDPHQLAAGRQRAEQQRRKDDAARPEAGQEGERDRVEPDAAADRSSRQLADRADAPRTTPPSPARPPDRVIASIIDPPALMPGVAGGGEVEARRREARSPSSSGTGATTPVPP